MKEPLISIGILKVKEGNETVTNCNQLKTETTEEKFLTA
jgi:hypothetical protein